MKLFSTVLSVSIVTAGAFQSPLSSAGYAKYISELQEQSQTTPSFIRSIHNKNDMTKLMMSNSLDENETEVIASPEKTEKKKETTWDRITGPKLFKTVTNWEGIHSVPLIPLRVLVGMLMIHHGSEGGFGPANYGTPEFQGFVDYIVKPYFSFLPSVTSPEGWAAIHDYIEYFGGFFFAIGFLTRISSLLLFLTMSFAVYFHLAATGLQGFPLGHVANYSYDFEEPLMYCLIFLVFWFNGAGPLSVDSIIYDKISQEGNDEEE